MYFALGGGRRFGLGKEVNDVVSCVRLYGLSSFITWSPAWSSPVNVLPPINDNKRTSLQVHFSKQIAVLPLNLCIVLHAVVVGLV